MGHARDRNAPDTDLVLAAKERRDGAAFGELMRRHQGRVYALALRLGCDEALAQDVVQETFLAAWRALPGFRGDSAFPTWIYRIAVHESRRALRRRPAVAALDVETLMPRFAADGHPVAGMRSFAVSGEAAVHREQVARAIAEALPSLPERYREAFLLRDVEDLSMQEMAEVLDLTVPAVKTRIHRARLMLRALLAERLGGEQPRGAGDEKAARTRQGTEREEGR